MSIKQISKTTNEEFLEGIAKNDISILKKIYEYSLPEVVKYVKRNSGTVDDAKDIFQEGILAVYRKVRSDQLTLTTDFHVFLFIVCKRIWLKKLKKSGIKEVTLEPNREFVLEEDLDERFIQSRKWSLFNEKFQQLAEECRKVLKMLFNGKSGKEIAEAMGYTEDYAKRKKYKCKLGLAALVKNDPEYKSLTNLN